MKMALLLQASQQSSKDFTGIAVSISWEGSAAWLDVEGTVHDGETARRLAMLSVNQVQPIHVIAGCWEVLALAVRAQIQTRDSRLFDCSNAEPESSRP